MFDFSKTKSTRSSGTPIISQITRRGSWAATSTTKSHSPFSSAFIMISCAIRSTDSSTDESRRGVKPLETMLLSLLCLGSSIFIIDPKKSSISSGKSTVLVAPCPLQKSSGLLLASATSECLTREWNPFCSGITPNISSGRSK